ncbi:MAG: hypothetical protein K9L57_09620 [Spirochaetaceae bacterium]|nr:hypothetical protein [Spirochaetia bacterium]MCF7951879.1 hypothetical protein [Spirochaetaceae bacterium]
MKCTHDEVLQEWNQKGIEFGRKWKKMKVPKTEDGNAAVEKVEDILLNEFDLLDEIEQKLAG